MKKNGNQVMKTPITVIIFNRPDHAAKLRDCLRGEESRELFVISDGPRPDRPGEIEQVEACRKIFSDWPSRMHFNFAEENMGCKVRVSSGLDWVFEHTDRSIILEDDLVPLPRFFTFCDEMLDAYSDCAEIMSISGSKVYPEDCHGKEIYFSKYCNCWGWATWKRAWVNYDDTFDTYAPLTLISRLQHRLGSYKSAIYWYMRLRQVLSGTKNSWFYCWIVSCFLKKGLHVFPGSNLVVNQGFGDLSTHTKQHEPYMPTEYGPPLPSRINLPANIETLKLADKWIDDYMYSKSLTVRILWIMKKLKLSK